MGRSISDHITTIITPTTRVLQGSEALRPDLLCVYAKEVGPSQFDSECSPQRALC